MKIHLKIIINRRKILNLETKKKAILKNPSNTEKNVIKGKSKITKKDSRDEFNDEEYFNQNKEEKSLKKINKNNKVVIQKDNSDIDSSDEKRIKSNKNTFNDKNSKNNTKSTNKNILESNEKVNFEYQIKEDDYYVIRNRILDFMI